MSCGIYKITNNINNKIYIGQSQNIEQRWRSHKYESINEKQKPYNYSIHKAFRKYGLDNFSFDIIEIVPKEKLNEREIYWINYYNSYKNGYNETLGGEGGPGLKEELNPRALLDKQDVIDIRQSILNGKMPSEVYPKYASKISLRGFQHIWRGETWENILPEAINYTKSQEYISKIRSFASKSKNKDIKNQILERKKNGEKRLQVFEDYKNQYSLSGFNKIWYSK